MEEADLIARIQRYLLIGQWGSRVPHIVFLDAGLAAKFDDRIYSNVQNFFESIIKCVTPCASAQSLRHVTRPSLPLPFSDL